MNDVRPPGRDDDIVEPLFSALRNTHLTPYRQRRTALYALALFALTLFGAWLRIRPAAFHLPQRAAADESYFWSTLERMRGDPADAHRDPFYGTYPHLVPRLVWLIHRQPVELEPGPLPRQLEIAGRDALRLRQVGALLSICAVPATWLLARRFLDQRAALLAAGLMATSLLHLWYANQAKPHGAASGLVPLAVAAALQVRRRGDARAYLLAGLAAGLAIGSAQAAVFALPALLVAHVLRERSGSRLALVWLGLALAIVVACAWLFCPHWFRSDPAIAPIHLGFELFNGSGFRKVFAGLWHCEPLYLVLGSVAAIAWVVQRLRRRHVRASARADLAIVLSHALPYGCFILLYERSGERYFLPLVPYVACLIAWGVTGASDALVQRVASRDLRGWIALAPGMALIAVQAAAALRLNAIFREPETAVRAAEWIEQHLEPARDGITVPPGLDLPLLRDPESLGSHAYGETGVTPWGRYQARLAGKEPGATTWRLFTLPLAKQQEWQGALERTPEYLATLGADFIVVELSDRAILAEVVDRLRAAGRLVARFSPMRVDDTDHPPFLYSYNQFEYRAEPCWVWRMLQSRSLGGVIEIYRVRSAPPGGH